MVYNMTGKTIIAVEWLDSTVAVLTLDDGTTVDVHHVKIKTKEEQLAVIEAEITNLQTTLTRKIEIKGVLDGTLIKDPIIKDPIIEDPIIKDPLVKGI